MVRRLVRSRTLPPALSPYGTWNDEAVDDIFQAWATQRLIERGDLRPMVARAGSPAVLHALAERSVRQFLLNARERTVAQNLYGRVRERFNDDAAFRCFIDSSRAQDMWWGLSSWEDRAPFNGDERLLARAAWSVADLVIIRYAASARKLSPLLDRAELKRFLEGLLGELQALLTIAHVMDALRQRLAISEQNIVSIDLVSEQFATDASVKEFALRETALLVIAELSARQVRVLLETAQGRPLADIGRTLGCAAGTVLNEQSRIASVLRRFSGDDEERDDLLKIVTDLLYQGE